MTKASVEMMKEYVAFHFIGFINEMGIEFYRIEIDFVTNALFLRRYHISIGKRFQHTGKVCILSLSSPRIACSSDNASFIFW